MTVEERLRRAIEARTSSVEPDDDGLERITERLLDRPGEPVARHLTRNPWFLAAAAAVIVVALVGGFAVIQGDGPDEVGTVEPGPTEATTTTGAPSTSGPAPSTTSTPTPPSTGGSAPTPTTSPSADPTVPAAPSVPADVLAQAAWPRPSSDVRFDDPAAAAGSFARYYVRFASPIVGAFGAADSHSGEVPVLPRAGGPETRVFVNRLSDGHWYVTGAATADIVVDRPAVGAGLSCPLAVRGRALAFEGTVNVRVDGYRPDGARVTLGEGTVTGSGTPPAGPFTGEIPCTPADGIEPSGLVMFREVDQSGDGTTALKATVHVVDLG